MIKEVKYIGYTAQPDDYQAADGELAHSANLIPDNGAIKAVNQPKVISDDITTRYVHNLTSTTKISANDYEELVSGSVWTATITIPYSDYITIVQEGNMANYNRTYVDVTITSGESTIATMGLYLPIYAPRKKNIPTLSPAPENIRVTLVYQKRSGSNTTPPSFAIRTYQIVESGTSTLRESDILIARHHTSDGSTNFIVKSSNGMYWLELEATDDDGILHFKEYNGSPFRPITGMPTPTGTTAEEVSDKIVIVGNTLVATTADGMAYALWQNGEYQYLGSSIPEIPLQFCLNGQESYGKNDPFIITTDSWWDDDNVISALYAGCNKFVNEMTKQNQFTQPFLVRYAYRLYDNSLVMHSSPVLMLTASSQNPRGLIYPRTREISYYIYYLHAHLYYRCYTDNHRTNPLEKWKDLIKSVDIFITPPIYTYEQSSNEWTVIDMRPAQGEGEGESLQEPIIFQGKLTEVLNGNSSLQDYSPQYRQSELTAFTHYDNEVILDRYPWRCTHQPLPKKKNITEQLKSASTFYYIASIGINSIVTGNEPQMLYIKDGMLSSLTAHEAMTDAYKVREPIVNANLMAYNKRLIAYDIARSIQNGQPQNVFPYFDRREQTDKQWVTDLGSIYNMSLRKSITMYFHIKKDGRTIIIPCNYDSGYDTVYGENLQYIFYPDPDAYQVVIRFRYYNGSSSDEYIRAEMKTHPYLNGAYVVANTKGELDYDVWRDFVPESGYPEFTLTPFADRKYYENNVVMLSEVSNPFVFRARNMIAIDVDHIIKLVTSSKALSQGQFGQFPIYAFADNGIYPIEIASDGTFSVTNAPCRDVALSTHAITQIDDSVLFFSKNGLMRLKGSDTQCLSNVINTEFPFSVDELGEDFTQYLASQGFTPASMPPFSTFIANGHIAYDYQNQRIILFNPRTENETPVAPYAYVYSFKDNAWGMMQSDIIYAVNVYPETWAVNRAGFIVNLSTITTHATPADTTPQLLVTRPLKLDMPDVMKTIDTVLQRGHFRKGHVKVILYGSRDLYNWQPVWSSKDHTLRGFRGTPYKYFRIALVCNLQTDESIFGATLQYTPRLTDQPR